MRLAKIHIILGMLVLCAGQAFGAGAKLDIIDYRGEYILNCDGTWFYGASSTVLKRYAVADYSASDGKDFGGTLIPEQVFIGQTAGEIFILIQDTADTKRYLHRSTDYGATSTQVDLVGYDADGWAANGDTPTHIPAVTIMPCGFKWDKWNSQYIYVEYNINGSRTDGAANDQVRVMKSADGITWSEVAHWNTDGSNQNTNYAHAVHVDPYESSIYLCFGDGVPSGFIKWDGTSALASNQAISAYDNALGGALKYNTLHIFFTETHISWGVDQSGDADEVGIWRTTKDLAAPTRVYNSIPTTGTRDLLYGLQTSNGMYITEHHADETDRTSFLYSSTDGVTWEKTARLQWQAATGIKIPVTAFFESNGYVYLALGQYAAGKGQYETLVLQEQGTFSEPDPIVIHPVYWVKTAAAGGNDSNDGWSPTTAWLTIKKALTSDKITYGGRVIVGAGAFSESATVADYNANSLTAVDYSTAPIVIEGQGRDSTFITHPDADANPNWLYFGDGYGRAIIKNISVEDLKTGSAYAIVFAGSTAASSAKITDARIGSASNVSTACVRIYANRTLTAERNIFYQGTGSYGLHLSNASGQYANLYHNLFLNGARSIADEDGTIVAYGNLFYNYSQAGIRVLATATVLPVMKNNIFYGAASGTRYGYEDGGSLTETDDTLNYNLFYSNTSATSGVASGVCDGTSDGCLTASDPLFVDVSSANFKLKANSPARNAGTALYTAVAYAGDYAGIMLIYGTAPDIGAYETYEEIEGIPGMPWLDDPYVCATTNAACYVQP